jgi:hypothetical protein
MHDEEIRSNPHVQPRQAAVLRRTVHSWLSMVGLLTCNDDPRVTAVTKATSGYMIMQLAQHVAASEDDAAQAEALRGIAWALAESIHMNVTPTTSIVEPECAGEHGFDLRYQSMFTFIQSAYSGEPEGALRVLAAIWDGSEGHQLTQAIDLLSNVMVSGCPRGNEHGITNLIG